MSHTTQGIFFFLIVFILTVSIFGGHFGWTTNGVPQGGDNILLDTFDFFASMITFNIDGLPVILNVVWLIINLLTLFIGFLILRGI
jgi:hypothetical protein